MKRTPLPPRTTRIRSFSRRRQAEADQRRAVVELVHRRDRTCRAASVVPEIACGGPLDCHELVARSAWAAGYLDPSNCISACRNHHSWIGDHSAEAKARGLRKSAWDR